LLLTTSPQNGAHECTKNLNQLTLTNYSFVVTVSTSLILLSLFSYNVFKLYFLYLCIKSFHVFHSLSINSICEINSSQGALAMVHIFQSECKILWEDVDLYFSGSVYNPTVNSITVLGGYNTTYSSSFNLGVLSDRYE
jgi:hypothetical protein